jgi:hypothetical protein
VFVEAGDIRYEVSGTNGVKKSYSDYGVAVSLGLGRGWSSQLVFARELSSDLAGGAKASDSDLDNSAYWMLTKQF